MLTEASTWSSAVVGVLLGFAYHYFDAVSLLLRDLGAGTTKIPPAVLHVLKDGVRQCHKSAYDVPKFFISAAVAFHKSPRLALEISFSWMYDFTVTVLVISKNIILHILNFASVLRSFFPGFPVKIIAKHFFVSLVNGYVGARLAVRATKTLLYMAGFTPKGIAKHSFASYIQSRYISVYARSPFTFLQSAGVKGISKQTHFKVSLIGAVAGILFMSLKWYIFLTICFAILQIYTLLKQLYCRWR